MVFRIGKEADSRRLKATEVDLTFAERSLDSLHTCTILGIHLVILGSFNPL